MVYPRLKKSDAPFEMAVSYLNKYIQYILGLHDASHMFGLVYMYTTNIVRLQWRKTQPAVDTTSVWGML